MVDKKDSFSVLKPGEKPFIPGSQEAVEMLEGILPHEKAMAVPYALIWEIDPNSGAACHPLKGSGLPARPLSMTFVTPPDFGSSVNSRFNERPAVSLERITIKSQNPRGMISYRTLELSFVVHKPEILDDDHIIVESIHEDGKEVERKFQHASDQTDSWSSLLYAGQCFALEYGWSADPTVKNAILNGFGKSDKGKALAIPGRNQIRFIVTNYTFQVQADNQIKFTLSAIEMGELNLRQAFLVDNKQAGQTKTSTFSTKPADIDPYQNKNIQKLIDTVKSIEEVKTKTKEGVVTSVRFGDLVNKIFSDNIEKAFSEIGFEFGGIFIGRFNSRVGSTVESYCKQDMGDKPISDFLIPIDKINDIFNSLLKAGERLTLYNFLRPFVDKMNDNSIWKRDTDQIGMVPNVTIRTIMTPTQSSDQSQKGKMMAKFYIFDARNEYVANATSKGNESETKNIRSKEQLYDLIVKQKKIPFISLMKANSYIQNSSFNMIQDDQMKSIFIRRAVGQEDQTRNQKVKKPSVQAKVEKVQANEIIPAQLTGELTMIGNFIFDVFNLVWIDFGFEKWSGFYNILEKTDVIENGSFTTTIRLQTEGINPYNFKSRKNSVK